VGEIVNFVMLEIQVSGDGGESLARAQKELMSIIGDRKNHLLMSIIMYHVYLPSGKLTDSYT
jgi:hypothetical protein